MEINQKLKSFIDHDLKPKAKHMEDKEKANAKLTTSLKVLKIASVVITSASALLTGFTNNKKVAFFTGGAGILTALVQVVDQEFKANEMREHAKLYFLKYKEMIRDIELYTGDDKKKLLEDSRLKFKTIEEDEMRNRPSFQSSRKSNTSV